MPLHTTMAERDRLFEEQFGWLFKKNDIDYSELKSFLRADRLAMIEAFREMVPREKELPLRIDLEIDAIGASNAIRNQGYNQALSDLRTLLATLSATIESGKN